MAYERRPTGAASESPAKGPTHRVAADTATARIHENSAWLRSTAARRVRQITAQLKDIDTSTYGAIVAPLGTTGPPGSRADLQCDRCLALPVSGELQMFVHRATARIYLAGGLCQVCSQKEEGAP